MLTEHKIDLEKLNKLYCGTLDALTAGSATKVEAVLACIAVIGYQYDQEMDAEARTQFVEDMQTWLTFRFMPTPSGLTH